MPKASLTITPKAFANYSPGLERSDNPGIIILILLSTLKGFGAWRTLSGLIRKLNLLSQGSRYAPTLGCN